MAVRISAKNDAHCSSSFFHLKYSVLLSFSKSAAMFEWVLTVAPTGQDKRGGVGGGGWGVLLVGFLFALGKIWAGKGGREKSVIVLTFVEVEKYLCSRCGSRMPAASRRNLLHVPVVSFRTKLALSLLTKPTFVTERISSLRHLLPC